MRFFRGKYANVHFQLCKKSYGPDLFSSSALIVLVYDPFFPWNARRLPPTRKLQQNAPYF